MNVISQTAKATKGVWENTPNLAEPLLRVLNVVLLAPVLHGVSEGLWIPGDMRFISNVLMPTVGLWWFQSFTLYTLGRRWSMKRRRDSDDRPWSRSRLLFALVFAAVIATGGLATHEYLSNRCRLGLHDNLRIGTPTEAHSTNAEAALPATDGVSSASQHQHQQAQQLVVNRFKGMSPDLLTDEEIRAVRLRGNEILVPLWLPERLDAWVSRWKGETHNQRLREFVNKDEVGPSNIVFTVRTLNSDPWAVWVTQLAFLVSVAVVMAGIGASVSIARAFLLESARLAHEQDNKKSSGIGVSIAVSLLLVALNMFLYWSQASEALTLLWLPPHIKPTAIVLSSAIGMVVFQCVFGIAHVNKLIPQEAKQPCILASITLASILALFHFRLVALCVIPVTVGMEAIPVPPAAAYTGAISVDVMTKLPLSHSRQTLQHQPEAAQNQDLSRPQSKTDPNSTAMSAFSPSLKAQEQGIARKAEEDQRFVYVPIGWPEMLCENLPMGCQDDQYGRTVAVRENPDWFSESAPNLFPWAYASTSVCFGLLFASITVLFVTAAALTGELFFESVNPLVAFATQSIGVAAKAAAANGKIETD